MSAEPAVRSDLDDPDPLLHLAGPRLVPAPKLSSAPDVARPRVFVTVGSDHHRFDRLVGWVDAWASARGLGPEDVLVQHGPAAAPRVVGGVDYLPHEVLLAHMASADVVVCQGGPVSILESRRSGRRPIVVPRTASLKEVVDDHQHAFCARVATFGWVDFAADELDLWAALDAGLATPDLGRVEPDPAHDQEVASNIARFGRVADGVLAANAPTRRRRSVRAAPDPPAVLVLGGFGRSGSTLLERALGEVPRVVAVGEVLHLWERGLRDGEMCGCGLSFWACPFWGDVGKRAYGGWSELDPAAAVADRTAVVRNGNIPSLVIGMLSPTRRLQRSRLRRRLGDLYVAATDVGDADLVVDSSKHPAYAFLVRGCRVRLKCVLVLRDPRGVAYSWSKTVLRPEVTDREATMPRYGVVASSLRWSLYSVLFSALSALGVPVLTVRYEDLVADPRSTVEKVLEFAGMPASPAALEHLHSDRIDLGVHHTVAGNPMRFHVGPTPVRLDEAWRREMPAGSRRIVGLLTAPLRRRYGYR